MSVFFLFSDSVRYDEKENVGSTITVFVPSRYHLPRSFDSLTSVPVISTIPISYCDTIDEPRNIASESVREYDEQAYTSDRLVGRRCKGTCRYG